MEVRVMVENVHTYRIRLLYRASMWLRIKGRKLVAWATKTHNEITWSRCVLISFYLVSWLRLYHIHFDLLFTMMSLPTLQVYRWRIVRVVHHDRIPDIHEQWPQYQSVMTTWIQNRNLHCSVKSCHPTSINSSEQCYSTAFTVRLQYKDWQLRYADPEHAKTG